jgi:mannosyltransferase
VLPSRYCPGEAAGGIAIDRIRGFGARHALLLSGFAVFLAGEAALLGHWSLGYDELFSIYFAQQGPSYLLGEGWHIETNPPLYYLLLDGWIALFGQSAAAVRSLSLLGAAATLPVVWRIGRAIGLRDGAWLAAALYLTSPLVDWYAAMARGYSLWLFALALALLAFIEAVSAPPERIGRWALLFAGAGLAALYLHDSTVIFLAAANLVFALDWLLRRRGAVRILILWGLPQLLLLAAGLPQLLIILAQRHSPNIAWIPPLSVLGVMQAAIALLSGHEYPFSRFQGAALLMTALVLALVVPARAPRSTRPLLALMAIALALLFATGLLLPRTALWLLLPLAVVQAAALSGLGRNWLAAAVLAILALNTADCLWEFQAEPSLRDFLARFDAERRPDDVVILLNGAPATALRYYGAGAGATIYRWDATPVDGPGTAIRIIDERIMPLPAIDRAGIGTLLDQGKTVWLIGRLRAHIRLEQALAQGFTLTQDFAFAKISPAK